MPELTEDRVRFVAAVVGWGKTGGLVSFMELLEEATLCEGYAARRSGELHGAAGGGHAVLGIRRA
eukprot:2067521-Pyramimonas_sp.AAC.2